MDQFAEEVQEEWRKEQLVQIWKKYGNSVIAFCLLLIGLAVGNTVLNHYQNKKIQSQTKIFEQALSSLNTQQDAKATKSFDNLVQEGTTGYKIFAMFQKVNLAEHVDEKTKLLHTIVKQNDLPKIYKDLASYYIMMLKFNNTRVSDYLHELNDFAVPQNYFVNYFLELKALSYVKLNQLSKAQEIAQTIMDNKATSSVLRTRMTALLSHIINLK